MTALMAAKPVAPAIVSHGKGRSCVITRRACFSASHRYWLPELSAAENEARFGPCSLAPGHGHNYELVVAMAGLLDANGMVLNLSDVKHHIREQVTAQLDFRCLNNCWEDFQRTLPTTEYLACCIWRRLQTHLPVVGIRVYEQPRLWADYLGNDLEAFLTISTHFAAAHRLARAELSQTENEAIYGKCARIHGHGHNYHLDVTVRGRIDPRSGMLCDLARLQQVVEEWVTEPFDHTFLNKDVAFFADTVPTAENIALHIADLLRVPITDCGAVLHKVRLQESPNNAAEVFVESPQLDMGSRTLAVLADA
ncbi:MAG: 6-pyruvoyl tetrahydropterin synthase [Aphanocapsa feldmannii 277cV]|uniref:6-carboxy-5,6,7,8-tetrahydropterin synthase n=2 Tax=Aphanocapsa feldmannii TaxID=192050 RepID=A0A524RQ23_9CHRO|nr:MAG: 6-pyruvoyl tetrahydropterin synthase [Aphanocapsa feldmannii 277cV]TGH25070.1 MAG: 6-pyruvoyl tetrahydropterin synthase [Aphanocapsa feldmannii 277cI]